MTHSLATNAASIGTVPAPRMTVTRLKALQKRLGLGRSSIYNLMNPKSPQYDPTFPRSIKLASHAIGWIESEVDNWLESRISISRPLAQNGGMK